MTVRVGLTGPSGFLGWHFACRAEIDQRIEAIPLTREQLDDGQALAEALIGVDAVVHAAGANRGTDEEIRDTNVRLARTLAAGLKAAKFTGPVVFANSTHGGRTSAYGQSKAEAWKNLSDPDATWQPVNIVLPNLFGEHGRPDYNSVVATFCQNAAIGEPLVVHGEQELELLHVQDAARALADAARGTTSEEIRVAGDRWQLGELATLISDQAETYANGVLPDLSVSFERRIFNQLRSYSQPFNIHSTRQSRFDNPRPLTVNSDARGVLTEVVKGWGGQTQTFFSTTHPDVTRGNHFHTSKVERFVVVQGRADIRLRRIGSRTVHTLSVSGSRPSVVDIPTWYTHSITNCAEGELLTLFWADEVFDADNPDTYARDVVETT